MTALLSKPIKNDYVMFYTSDHGQTFHDDGREGHGTHCSIIITDPEEGTVPFIAFTNISSVKAKLKNSALINKNKVSQFNIPSTLYNFMGYSLSDLTQYELPIYSKLYKKDQQFLSKYFVRFGDTSVWNSIY